MRVVLAIVSLSVTIAACANPDRTPVAPAGSMPPLAATSAARAKPVPNTRAIFAYQDIAQDTTRRGRLIGDGRDSTGRGPGSGSSVYSDGSCGVSAEIFISGSGDATMDPTAATTSCEPRSLKVEFGPGLGGSVKLGAIEGSFFTNVRDVQSLAINSAPVERRFRLLLRGFAGCDYLRYENANGLDGVAGTSDDVTFGDTIKGRSILVTRIDSGTGPRRWRAASQPDTVSGRHVAMCERTVRKGSPYVGAYDIPFVLEVTEK